MPRWRPHGCCLLLATPRLRRSRLLVFGVSAGNGKGCAGVGLVDAVRSNASWNDEAGLDSVSCTAWNACMAVGQYENKVYLNSPLVEHWDGVRWSIQRVPANSSDSWFTAVSCSSPGACTAVGYTGAGANSLVERWNGTKWSIQRTTAFGELFAVSCASKTICNAVGRLSSKRDSVDPVAEHWDGSTWSLQPMQPVPSDNVELPDFAGVSCSSRSVCLAVGGVDSDPGTFPLTERWNGMRWSVASVVRRAAAVSCTSTSACMAVGGNNGSAHPFASHWNGSRWSIQLGTVPDRSVSSLFSAVSCTQTRFCNAVGDYFDRSNAQFLLAERWDGVRWSVEPVSQPPDVESASLNGVSCLATTACVAVGGFTDRAHHHAHLLVESRSAIPPTEGFGG